MTLLPFTLGFLLELFEMFQQLLRLRQLVRESVACGLRSLELYLQVRVVRLGVHEAAPAPVHELGLLLHPLLRAAGVLRG